MTAIADRLRVSIRIAEQHVDLTVAANLPLRDLLPALLDALAAETGIDLTGRELHLSHPLAGPLDPTRSLAQSGVCHGELLILTDVKTPRARPEFDPCAIVAAAVRSVHRPPSLAMSTVAVVITGWSAVVAAAMLGWPVLAPQAPRNVLPTIGVGCAVLLSAMVCQRRGVAAGVGIGLALGACGFAALAGWLTVPGGPAPGNAALAMSACAVAALAAARTCSPAAVALRSLCAVSASTAVLTVGVVLQCWPAAAAGPVLVAGWLAVLSAAPRLVTRSTRLSAADRVDENLTVPTLIAHRRLTATVGTATGGAVLGCLITAATTPRSPASLGLIIAVAAILLLRIRIHAETSRAVILAVGAGLVSATLLGAVVIGAPALVPWLCGSLAVVCAAGMRWSGDTTRQASPSVRRAASAAEFAAAAAIVPLACWAIGLFGAMRELSLS